MPGLPSSGAQVSSTFAVDAGKQGGDGNRWADQEAVFEFKGGEVVRASFRFLHGSTSEFLYKAANWHQMQS
eukprot:SAG22_NODE_14083_length_385_cov_0.727273_1_plen_70_part_10